MKKNFFRSTLLALAFVLTFTTAAFAADTTSKTAFDNFTKKQTYTAGVFTDVKSGWIEDAVKPCYELNLMNGKGNKVFDPTGNVTLGEAISMAARVHEIYNGGDGVIDQAEGKWYAGAVKYAIDKGIIKADAYSDYTAKATRTNLAQIFYAAIPANQFKAINKIEALPDVTEKTEGAAAILSLYKAGVLTGSDEYGTFNPTTNIKRSEAAAIITRVAVPTERKLITLKTKESTTPAAITFLSKDKLFEVTVPATWKEKTTYGSINSSLELNSANETVVYISSLSKKKDQPTDYNLTKFIAEYTPSLSKSFIKPEISTTTAITINGLKGVSFGISGMMNDVDMVIQNYILENNDYYIVEAVVFPKADKATVEADALAILNSFKLK